jgi:hypothetical protein
MLADRGASRIEPITACRTDEHLGERDRTAA